MGGYTLKFEDIDPILMPWAKTNGFFVGTEFKETPVRSISVIDAAGNEYRIGLDITEDEITVHGSGQKGKIRCKEIAAIGNLDQALSKILNEIEKAMGDKKPNRAW